MTPLDTSYASGFGPADWIVVVLYLVGVTVLGIRMGGRQTSAQDYFFSEGKIPGWGVCLAIVATETSSLTFLSIPGLAYAGNWNFLELAFGYLIGRVFVAYIFLPRYFQGELTTAYALMEKRFGLHVRRAASIVFMFTRIMGDGVRLFATAIPIAVILKAGSASGGFAAGVSDGVLYVIAILITGDVTIVYVQVGGVRAVIWTDIIQFFLYVGGAVAAVVILVMRIPDLGSGLAGAWGSGKLLILDLEYTKPLSSPYRLWSAVIGGIFLSMASHGTDQIIVQRLFAAGSLKPARRALIGSGVIVLLQFGLFLFLGTLLYLFYHGAPFKGDEVFARFIVNEMPPGVSGLIVAAVLAAAMSTLSGSVSALASASIYDFYANTHSGRMADEKRRLWLSRAASLAWGVILVASALFFVGTQHAVVELTLQLASFTYGGLLGLFLVGAFVRRATTSGALIGFGAGLVVMLGVIVAGILPWTLYTIVGALCTVAAAWAFSLLSRSRHP
ncbi:MAG: sodium:solute symporter [Spirochaetia bacterium]|nr:sodium:solute symporter [Spirochaetia bacterium]